MTDSKSPSSAALPAGEQEFHDWFAANYSGEVVFSDPRWHSEKILRWARRAALAAPRSPVPLTVAKIVSLGPRGTDDEAIRWARVIEAEHGIVPGPASTSPDADVDPRGPDHRKGWGIDSMGWAQNGCRITIRPKEEGAFLLPFPQELDITLERVTGPVDREKFITRYVADSEITRDEFDRHYIALPCDCDHEGCEGWAAVPRSVDRIMGHIAGTAESKFLDMRAELGKLKNKQNALLSFVEALSVDKGADPALRQRATEALDAGDTPTHKLLGITKLKVYNHLMKVYAPIEKPEDSTKEAPL